MWVEVQPQEVQQAQEPQVAHELEAQKAHGVQQVHVERETLEQ